MNTATDEELFSNCFKEMYAICQRNNWGDPFSYSRSREIHMANTLKHKIAITYSGADAVDEDGECEYKSTINKNINGTYNGISVQDTLEEQIRYIKEEKIGKYHNHYYARYENGDIVEVWKLKYDIVLDLLLPKIIKEYPKKKFGSSKDPRLGAMITKKEIYKFGTRII